MEPDVIQESAITDIAHIIQLSVAPVFLLSGIGAMLAVMANRLSRIVDRARRVETDIAADPIDATRAADELAQLSRRAKLISLSIGLFNDDGLAGVLGDRDSFSRGLFHLRCFGLGSAPLHRSHARIYCRVALFPA
jgi:hypothetical protein